jgi:uncharacterized protein YqeY
VNTSQLKKDKLLARKDGNTSKVEAINYVLSAVETIELRNNKQLSGDEVISTIKKVVSELKETEQMYTDASKPDMAGECACKIAALEPYLPQMLSQEQTTTAIEKAIADVGAIDIKDMGKVMGLVKKELGATVDMSLVSKIVKKKLS